MVESLIKIGTTIEKSELGAVTDALVRIMECNAEQRTKRKALDTFTRLVAVQNLHVSGCHLIGEQHTHNQPKPEEPAITSDVGISGGFGESPDDGGR